LTRKKKEIDRSTKHGFYFEKSLKTRSDTSATRRSERDPKARRPKSGFPRGKRERALNRGKRKGRGTTKKGGGKSQGRKEEARIK